MIRTPWRTIRESAEYLGVSRERVYAFVRDGRLSTKTVLGLKVIPWDELQRFRRQRRKTGRPKG